MMKKEEIFAKELAAVVRLGKNQGNTLSKEQVKEGFPLSEIEEEKLTFVYEYLEKNQIRVDEAFDPDAIMSSEDKDFVAMFLEDIASLPKLTDEEVKAHILGAMEDKKESRDALIPHYLEKVVEIAKLYAGQGVLMEDLIGEGNVALIAAISMMSCVESLEEADGYIAGIVMDAMEVLIAEEVDAKEVDDKIAEKVNLVAEAAEALYADLRRKVTPEELAAETDFTVAEIVEAYKLSAEQIDTITIESEQA